MEATLGEVCTPAKRLCRKLVVNLKKCFTSLLGQRSRRTPDGGERTREVCHASRRNTSEWIPLAERGQPSAGNGAARAPRSAAHCRSISFTNGKIGQTTTTPTINYLRTEILSHFIHYRFWRRHGPRRAERATRRGNRSVSNTHALSRFSPHASCLCSYLFVLRNRLKYDNVQLSIASFAVGSHEASRVRRPLASSILAFDDEDRPGAHGARQRVSKREVGGPGTAAATICITNAPGKPMADFAPSPPLATSPLHNVTINAAQMVLDTE
ncbi:hypothetical protein EVAR_26640_1 [Eumeta japonica]|uniref:Uncharacterized protein n=1 Tax=Eumeta variegata TaxID=151549 RepID=A0A4C1VKC5_EUMVA|nr:hypothetical protein EVAR_26640_1 [Eumeta japonica]